MRFSLLPKLYFSPVLRLLPPYYNRIPLRNMSTDIPESKSPITADEKVKKFQQVFHSSSTNSWDKCGEENLTPWDLWSPTPVLVHLHNTGSLPKGRALVPGCGSGYDVVEIACAERHVVGLDSSDNAIKKAIEAYAEDLLRASSSLGRYSSCVYFNGSFSSICNSYDFSNPTSHAFIFVPSFVSIFDETRDLFQLIHVLTREDNPPFSNRKSWTFARTKVTTASAIARIGGSDF